MNMQRFIRSLLPLALLVLGSCQVLMDKDFHTSVAPSSITIGGKLDSLNVADAPMDERTGNMINRIQITDYVIRQWYIGLDDAIIQSGMFVGPRKFAVAVSIRRVSVPLVGLGVCATVEARYEVTDRATGNSLYANSIESEGCVPVDYAFAGVVRGSEAINRGVRNNIKAFIADLEKALSEHPVARRLPAEIVG